MADATGKTTSKGTRRKSETRQRQRVRHFRFESAEDDALKEAAAGAGLSVTAYVRERTLGSAGARTFRKRADRVELCRLLGELGKIGSNVNQLARMANGQGAIPVSEELDRLGDEVRAMSRAVMSALGRSPEQDGD